MSIATLAGPRKSVAVTLLGLITLLPGGYCATFGGWAIFAGEDWLAHPSNDPWMQVIALGGILPAFIILFGVAVLLLGILGLLAGLGVLLRKQWGRILTFIIAVVAILLGLAVVSGSGRETAPIAFGSAQILYGILAFVILIVKGAEFSRPRV